MSQARVTRSVLADFDTNDAALQQP
jgi:hypothetical protein